MPDNLPSLDKVDDIARVCHEANRAYCIGHGDHTHMPWDQTPGDLKQSARSGVMTAAKLRLTDLELAAEHMHKKWVRYKLDEGWRVGPEKDHDKKLHPSLVAWEQLDPIEQAKDRLFCGIVRALLADGSQG